MTRRKLSRLVLRVCVPATLLAGCGGSQAPIGAQGAMPQTSAIAPHAERGKSWMLPGQSSGDLLYAPGGCDGTCVISYPALNLVGSLATRGEGACSDSQGNVFLPAGGTVTEYAHGGTEPIATLDLSGSMAEGCSVDSATNNLAVVYKGNGADIAVFSNEQGNPTLYISQIDSFYCGYDNAGDLFVDGMNGQQPGFSELRNGAGQFAELSIPYTVGLPGQVQWDGRYITYESSDQTRQISRLSISGSAATVVGTTKFTSMRHRSWPSWLYGNRVIVPYNVRGERANVISIWKYPKGRHPTKTIRKFPPYKKTNIDFIAVTLSI
jgi:hypothetical protein